jgi:hypothetical protein
MVLFNHAEKAGIFNHWIAVVSGQIIRSKSRLVELAPFEARNM